ncbi:MAG: hypothetical protein JWO24_4147 [Rhodospirillales bacterium]|nr:hypothetical protein [Rhodospirillales bacterium]
MNSPTYNNQNIQFAIPAFLVKPLQDRILNIVQQLPTNDEEHVLHALAYAWGEDVSDLDPFQENFEIQKDNYLKKFVNEDVLKEKTIKFNNAIRKALFDLLPEYLKPEYELLAPPNMEYQEKYPAMIKWCKPGMED